METATNLVDFLNKNYSIKERKRLVTRERARIRIRFRPRTKKKSGRAQITQWIYIRIAVNGVMMKSDISTGISCDFGTWDVATQRIKGYSHKVEEKNRALRQIEDDIMTLYNDLRQKGVIPTAEMIKDLYRGTKVKSLEHLGFVAYYKSYIEHHQNEISEKTLKSYKSRLKRLGDYL